MAVYTGEITRPHFGTPCARARRASPRAGIKSSVCCSVRLRNFSELGTIDDRNQVGRLAAQTYERGSKLPSCFWKRKRPLLALQNPAQRRRPGPAIEGCYDVRMGQQPQRQRLRLPDRIGPEVRVLFVGINPGIRSATVGHHFAGYSNRFWKLLRESGLVPEPLSWEHDSRLPEWGFGITNLVARATPGISDLRPQDRKSTRLNSSHIQKSRMPSSA